MSRQDRIDRIVASLYGAMLDQARWPETSALIDDACGVAGTHLVIVRDGTRLFDKVRRRGEPLDPRRREYAESCVPRNGCTPRVMGLSDRRVVRVMNLHTECELKALPNGTRVLWAVADRIEPERWTDEQIDTIERLCPHLRHYVRVRLALISAEARDGWLTGLLDTMMLGVICLDWRGMVVQANGPARAILRHGDGLVDRGGFLHATESADDRQLGRLLAHAMPQSDVQGIGGSIAAARCAAQLPLILHVSPLGVHDTGFGIGHVGAFVLVVDPCATPSIDRERLAASLGLTEAESHVAVALANGATEGEIASASCRAESTVHELVKRIHDKLDLSRRADLVRTVLSASAGPGVAAEGPLATSLPKRRRGRKSTPVRRTRRPS